MPELTRDIVRKSPQIVNTLKCRELSLRGMHLTQLPVTDSQLWTDIVTNFDTLDLSDNLLQWLDAPHLMTATEMQDRVTKNNNNKTSKNEPNSKKNEEVDDFLSFLLQDNTSSSSNNGSSGNAALTTTTSSTTKLAPLKIRLSSIILHNNDLRGISKTFATQFGLSLKSLVLNGNSISELSACDVFSQFQLLERLSLVRNPVEDKQFYRLYIIGTCSKTLKLLDFTKIRDQERERALEYKKQREEEFAAEGGDENNNQHGNNGLKVGGGRRAARKAAAAAVEKRDRNATEEQITGTAGATSISTKVGDVVAATGGKQNQQQDNSNSSSSKISSSKKYTREELMDMLDDEDLSLEDMNKIEQMMNELGE